MYYSGKEKILYVRVEEAVSLAYARYVAPDPKEAPSFGITLATGTDEGILRSLAKGKEPTVPFGRLATRDVAFGELSLRLVGVLEAEDDVLSLRLRTEDDPKELSDAARRYVRGVAFVLCYLFGNESPSFCAYVSSSLHPEGVCIEETPSKRDVERFLKRLCDALRDDVCREVERVVLRLPSFLSVPFPYGEARTGQSDMMQAVYAAAKHGETLFAMAPTGTGKTMAALFPAIRALGARYVEKVFYLTPKTTSARAALDAVTLLNKRGARVRAVHLAAKESLCPTRRETGSCAACTKSCARGRESEATEALLAENKVAVGRSDVERVAAAYSVCPHELALSYSTYADVVVCDYNYLFDPRVRLSRYFDRAGEYLFLIDEAHNLPDRAREMYSATLDTELFSSLCSLLEGVSTRLAEVARRLRLAHEKTVDTILRDELRTDERGETVGFSTVYEPPLSLLNLLGEGVDILKKGVRPLYAEDEESKRALLDAVHGLKDALDRAEAFDEHFVAYAERVGEKRRLKLFAVDPSSLIGESLDKGRAAVFFSATLAPLDYYRSVIAGRRVAHTIDLPSPFDVGALALGVIDSVSVRASQREETLAEIARIIISAMRARRGNYMVFCPSFDYLERVAEAFHRLTPRTPYAVQRRGATLKEREAFLKSFSEENAGYFVGFCVTGGIYAEGVDLAGDRLIGAIVIGLGLPAVSAERELIASYYRDISEEGALYAYFYPALNRILQAAGRVIRTEEDRGVVVLIDDRLRDAECRKMFPDTWKHLKYLPDRTALGEYVARFWDKE